MKKELSNFGTLILPNSKKASGLVIFYPPATGEQGYQMSEGKSLLDINLASLIYNAPYIKNPNTEGCENAFNEVNLWMQAKVEFKEMMNLAEENFGLSSRDVILSGKNLGGSTAAFVSDDNLRALIVTGAVPILSKFRTESLFPLMAQARSGVSQQKLETFNSLTKEFDLTETMKAKKINSFVQFGRKDPWIESEQYSIFENEIKNTIIDWTEDDHAMNSIQSLQNRRNFIVDCWIEK